MESILINPGLEAIGIIIFEQMNNQELCNCRLVCKVWSEFIDSVKFYHKKILGHELSYPKQWLQSRKEWQYLIRKLKLHGEKESVIKMGLILRYDWLRYRLWSFHLILAFHQIQNWQKNRFVCSRPGQSSNYRFFWFSQKCRTHPSNRKFDHCTARGRGRENNWNSLISFG